MELCTSTIDLKRRLKEMKSSYALIPTMGSLHEGHLSLIKLAKPRAAKTIVTLFVNPHQFNDAADFEKYPRNIAKDIGLLESIGTDFVFAPAATKDIFHPEFESWIVPEPLSQKWEGASRPGHFKGVASVVAVLFSLIKPTAAVFGEKDFQQLRIIENLTRDLQLGIEIVRCPIIREEGGLALSSRNVRLSSNGKSSALALSSSLKVARDAFVGGERRADVLKNLIVEMVNAEASVKLDYAAIVTEKNLNELTGEISNELLPIRALIAAEIEGVRLIDNMELRAV